MKQEDFHNQKPFIFKLTKKRQQPALEGRFYPMHRRISSTETIYDSERNIMRTIRYAPGEPSIFMDEQSTKVKLGDIVFQNGKIVVDRRNPNLKNFLELSNHNADNPDRMDGKEVVFKLIDDAKTAKENVSDIVKTNQAVSAAIAMEWDIMKGYARTLGVNVNKSTDEVRHDMILIAEKDPDKFLDGIDNPVTKHKQVILDAQQYKLITIQGRSVKWDIGEKKGIIVNIPVGRDALEYLAEWMMTEKDGEDIYKDIQSRLSKIMGRDED
jgi:hypothetical protein